MINLPNDPNLGRFPIDTYEVISAKYFNFITRSPGIRYCMYVFDSLRERQVGKPFWLHVLRQLQRKAIYGSWSLWLPLAISAFALFLNQFEKGVECWDISLELAKCNGSLSFEYSPLLC
eukprot:UN26518